jgi:choice-of-anchor A domain-containing protein
LSDATILINVRGANVIFTNFDMEYLKDHASRIVWNFPDAKSITITGSQLYGSIVAPLAVLSGNGVISGQVFAFSQAGTVTDSLSISYVYYEGYKFGF